MKVEGTSRAVRIAIAVNEMRPNQGLIRFSGIHGRVLRFGQDMATQTKNRPRKIEGQYGPNQLHAAPPCHIVKRKLPTKATILNQCALVRAFDLEIQKRKSIGKIRCEKTVIEAITTDIFFPFCLGPACRLNPRINVR